MIKIAVMTMKGGTGKTTTAVNLSHGLALSGKKVLLLDCDPQRNVALTFGVESDSGLDKLLTTGDVEILKVRDNLFIVDSGGRRLADVEMILGNKDDRERRLAESLKYLKGCDFLICDCPPSINLININVLNFCEHLIIPVGMDHLSQHGISQTMEIMEEILQFTRNKAVSYNILPTFYDGRTRISEEVFDQISKKYGERMFHTVIRINTSLREAPGQNKTIYEHAPLSRGAYDYYRLTEEIIGEYE